MQEEQEESEFGDFEEILEESENEEEQPVEQEGYVRARWPKNGEIIGTIIQRYGGNRMEVMATDGKILEAKETGRVIKVCGLKNYFNDKPMNSDWTPIKI